MLNNFVTFIHFTIIVRKMPSLVYISQQCIMYIGSFLFIAGIVGNLLNIFLLLIQRSYRKSSLTFLFLTVGINDSIMLIIGLLYNVLTNGYNFYICRDSVIFCKLRTYLFNSIGIIPSTCVVLITINQYLITSRNVNLRQLSTIKNAHRAVICVITFYALINIPYLFFSNISSMNSSCSNTNTTFQNYNIFYNFLIRGVLFLFVGVVFGFLVSRNLKNTVVLAQQRADRQ